MWKVMGRFKQLNPYLQCLIWVWTTSLDIAALGQRFFLSEWCEIPIHTFQCKLFKSEMFLGDVNVNCNVSND